MFLKLRTEKNDLYVFRITVVPTVGTWGKKILQSEFEYSYTSNKHIFSTYSSESILTSVNFACHLFTHFLMQCLHYLVALNAGMSSKYRVYCQSIHFKHSIGQAWELIDSVFNFSEIKSIFGLMKTGLFSS